MRRWHVGRTRLVGLRVRKGVGPRRLGSRWMRVSHEFIVAELPPRTMIRRVRLVRTRADGWALRLERYNEHMRKASIRDLRIHASKLVRDAENGERIVIERRGHPVAELRPLSEKPKQPPLPDMSEIWNTFPQVPGDSGRFLEEDR
jgi:prevent-host-death family protein